MVTFATQCNNSELRLPVLKTNPVNHHYHRVIKVSITKSPTLVLINR